MVLEFHDGTAVVSLISIHFTLFFPNQAACLIVNTNVGLCVERCGTIVTIV